MTIKCPTELKKQLEEYINGEYHWKDETWVDSVFAIIDKYYKQNPPPTECEWSDCNKEVKHSAFNMAGDITYNYCETHFKWHKKHVRSFQILEQS